MLIFDTCKIACDVTLLDKAYLFLELSVNAERTRFIPLKPVLGGVDSVAHFITVNEQSE